MSLLEVFLSTLKMHEVEQVLATFSVPLLFRHDFTYSLKARCSSRGWNSPNLPVGLCWEKVWKAHDISWLRILNWSMSATLGLNVSKLRSV